MVPVVVALGSNVGDSLANLRSAVQELDRVLLEIKTSPIFQTSPMYVENQPDFLNAAVFGLCELGPLAMLNELKSIESRIGRIAGDRFGPREIDLDLVAYGVLQYRGPRLQVPHPLLPERRFVLLPMSYVAPGMRLGDFGFVEELLRQTENQVDDVVPIEHALLPVPSHG
jgi:2-amino-4-hydroxy-6-hydroxymethyldihydropteridine diphosphokinase